MMLHHIDPRTKTGVECADSSCALDHYLLFTTLTKKSEPVENLNDDFAQFMKSAAATAAPLDRGNWRAAQNHAAEVNGDIEADANPDTSLTNAIYDPTPDDEDLSMFEPF